MTRSIGQATIPQEVIGLPSTAALAKALNWLLHWHNSPEALANCRPDGYGYMPSDVAETVKKFCDAEAAKNPYLVWSGA